MFVCFVQVEVCDYLGHNRRVIIQGGVGRPLFIALYEEKVYVSSDWGPRKEEEFLLPIDLMDHI